MTMRVRNNHVEGKAVIPVWKMMEKAGFDPAYCERVRLEIICESMSRRLREKWMREKKR